VRWPEAVVRGSAARCPAIEAEADGRRINRELADAVADPVVRERFQQQRAEPMATSPEDAAKFISADPSRRFAETQRFVG
jgi:hypothetical protein